MGAGPIGLAVIQCLKARGASKIISAEISKDRRDLARKLGATSVIDPLVDDVVHKTQELCTDQGPHVAFDCAGVSGSIKSACLAVRYRGCVVSVAIWERDVPFDFNALVFGEKKVVACKYRPVVHPFEFFSQADSFSSEL